MRFMPKMFFLVVVLVSVILQMACIDLRYADCARKYDNWTTVKLSPKISFQIPPTMEIQSDVYKSKESELIRMVNPYNLPRIVAQQKGLNNMEKEAFSHYARAVLKIVPLTEYTFSWGDKLTLSAEDLSDIEAVCLDGTDTGAIKLVAITQHAKVVDLNEGQCVNIKYHTKYQDYPIAYNDCYYIFNGDELYVFLTMIRSTEYDYWTSTGRDMRNIVYTIDIL